MAKCKVMFISRHMLTEMSTTQIKIVKRYAKLKSAMEVECSTSISTDEDVKGENEVPWWRSNRRRKQPKAHTRVASLGESNLQVRKS